jgi:tRNA-splicing ligase RtcB
MECALAFALENRKRMIEKIVTLLGNPKELLFINRNHNHAQLLEGGYVIHRKGATHANKDMLGVVPGNMRDGSFIVRGKGNEESLCSSSHGAGRVLSRNKALSTLSLDEFHQDMQKIVSNHTDATLDESPRAYKNIFEVMELQKDLVDVIDYVRPFLNIKG